MNKDEALRMALEALEKAPMGYSMESDIRSYKAITAIKQALEQPDGEPVAWMVYTQDGQSGYVTDNPTDIQEGQRALPLYTSPPKREPLTLGQKQRLWSSLGNKPTLKDRVNAFGLAIEAAHGIKGEA